MGSHPFRHNTQSNWPLTVFAIAFAIVAFTTQLILCEPAHAAERHSDTALLTAVRQGDLAKVRALLDQGADPDARNAYGTPALFFAASPSAKGSAQKTSGQVLKLLLQHGAHVDAQAANGETALIAAAGSGSVDNVQRLLTAGADPNLQTKNGDSALLEATTHGFTAIVISLLLDHADPNLKDINGRTPLMVAILQAPRFSLHRSPYEVIAEALLAHGADPDARDRNGQTPATLVAAGDKNVLIYPLLDHHADINAADPTADGSTPLIIAARHGNTPLVRALLRAHPDLAYRDRQGNTALDYARQSHFSEIVTLLSQAEGHH